MKGVILCGGFAKRLGNITKEIPKALLKIGEKSVIERQLELLKSAGIDEVVLASGHLHEKLEEALGNSFAGLKIKYAKENEPLGTGGAIKNALKNIATYPAVILNGDILLDLNLREMIEFFRPEMDGLLLAVKVDDASSYGRIEFDAETKKILSFTEKDPSHRGGGFINGGIYIFNRSIWNYFPNSDKFSIEYHVFPNVQNLYAYPFDGEWIDIGTPERLQFARKFFSDEKS